MVWRLLFQLLYSPFLPHIPREATVAHVLPASNTSAACHAVTTPRATSMLTMLGLLASWRPLPQVCRERRGGLGDSREGLWQLRDSVLLNAGAGKGFICSTERQDVGIGHLGQRKAKMWGSVIWVNGMIPFLFSFTQHAASTRSRDRDWLVERVGV